VSVGAFARERRCIFAAHVAVSAAVPSPNSANEPWRNPVFIVIGIAVAIGLGLFFFRGSDTTSPAEDTETEPDRGGEDERLARGADDLEPSAVDASGSDAGEPPSVASPTTVPGPRVLPPDATDRATQARADLISAVLSRTEPSPENESRIRAGVETFRSAHPDAPEVTSVRCSGAICELHIQHTTIDGARAMATQLLGVSGFGGDGLMVRRATGSGFETTYFVAQTAASLPR
jgi:hypothetical protein